MCFGSFALPGIYALAGQLVFRLDPACRFLRARLYNGRGGSRAVMGFWRKYLGESGHQAKLGLLDFLSYFFKFHRTCLHQQPHQRIEMIGLGFVDAPELGAAFDQPARDVFFGIAQCFGHVIPGIREI